MAIGGTVSALNPTVSGPARRLHLPSRLLLRQF